MKRLLFAVVCAMAVTAATLSAALTDNLAAYYELESNGNDSHSSGVNLTAGGTPAHAAAVVGNGADFEAGDAADVYFANDNATWSFGDTDFTICFIVQLESKAATMGLVTKFGNDTGTNREWAFQYNNSIDRFQLVVGDGSGFFLVDADNFGSPSAGVPYFICGGHDSVNNLISINVNAGTPNTLAHSTGVLDGNAPGAIGAYWTGTTVDFQLFADAVIDQVGIWDQFLDSTELTDYYNGSAGRSYAGLSGGGGGATCRGGLMLLGAGPC